MTTTTNDRSARAFEAPGGGSEAGYPDYVDGVEPPLAAEALACSTTPFTSTDIALVGCHGGAGVDTLAALITGTVAVGQMWPLPTVNTPVVLVARETLHGLEKAHLALRQWITGGTPEGVELIGLVLVAGSRAKISAPVAVKRRLVEALAPAVFTMDWHEELLGLPRVELPTFDVSEAIVDTRKRPRSLLTGITKDIATLGSALAPWIDSSLDHVEDHEPDTYETAVNQSEQPLVWADVLDSDLAMDTEYPLDDDQDGHSSEGALIKSSAPGSVGSSTRVRRVAIISVIGAAVLLLTLAIAAVVRTVDGGTSRPSEPIATPPAACTESVDGPVTVGNGAGGQTSGPDAILAWNRAYYVERDAAAARSVTADGAVAAEPELQAAINKVPAGTTHCLTITDLGAGRYDVALTVLPPDGAAPKVLHQVIETTSDSDGTTWITAIRKAG